MDNTTTITEIPTKKLEEVAAAALRDAKTYKTCKDGSYEACLAAYNYRAVMAELHRRIKC